VDDLQYLNGHSQSYISTMVMRISAALRDLSLRPEASHWAGCHTAETQKREIASAGNTRHWRPSQSRVIEWEQKRAVENETAKDFLPL
jgi:hypothetical protein